MSARFLPALALALCLASGLAPAEPAAAPASIPTLPASEPAPAPAAAPVQPAPASPAMPMASASAGNLLQTIFALTAVLGLLAGLAWFLKRYGPRPGGGSAQMRVVGALNLGGRERIVVVEVGQQWIVVGASPGRINALATMPAQEGAPGPAVLEGHQPSAASFSEWLKQTIDKRNAK